MLYGVGDDAPCSVFPTVVGRPRYPQATAASHFGNKTSWIGDEAQARRGMLSLQFPIEDGIGTLLSIINHSDPLLTRPISNLNLN